MADVAVVNAVWTQIEHGAKMIVKDSTLTTANCGAGVQRFADWQVMTMRFDLRPRLVECPDCGWIAVLDPKHMGNEIGRAHV